MKTFHIFTVILFVLTFTACSIAPLDEKHILGKSDDQILTSLTAADSSGSYPNLYGSAASTLVNDAWTKFTTGSTALYFEMSGDTTKAIIKDVNGGGTPYVYSEGQSYGMMICVQLNKQTEFDKLWKFAWNNMRQTSSTHYNYMAWKMNVDGTVADVNPAPDGDIWMAAALYMADARWGSSLTASDYKNYRSRADDLTYAMLHQNVDGQGCNMFTNTANGELVVFVPVAGANQFTDPSYNLPHFFELFAEQSANDGYKSGSTRWHDISVSARTLLHNSVVQGSMYLPADFTLFNGTPTNFNGDLGGYSHADFAYDAWRVIANIAIDQSWWNANANAVGDVERILSKLGQGHYGETAHVYWRSGSAKTNMYTSAGLVGMNTVGTILSLTNQYNSDLRDRFTNQSINAGAWDSGNYRYYHNILHYLAILQTTGNFQYYRALTPNATYQIKSKVSGLVFDIEQVSTNNGMNCHQWTWLGANNQKFKNVIYNGYSTLQAVHSGKNLDTYGATTNNTQIKQYSVSYSDNQLFSIYAKPNGFYQIISKNANKSIDMSGSMSTGTVMKLWDTDFNNDNQSFMFIKQ